MVCPDLPGYGGSERLGDGPGGFDKSLVAAHMIALMGALGHDRFAIVGHDRGALVAFRTALNHPEAITHLGALDVIPTVDNWAALHGPGGVFAFHLYLLAQPSDLPERLIAADPDTLFGHFLDTWTTHSDAIPADIRSHYLDATRRPEVIHAICDDYRASAFIDADQDDNDQQAGRTLTMPVLAAWQDPGDVRLPFDPQQIWSSWAPDLRYADPAVRTLPPRGTASGDRRCHRRTRRHLTHQPPACPVDDPRASRAPARLEREDPGQVGQVGLDGAPTRPAGAPVRRGRQSPP